MILYDAAWAAVALTLDLVLATCQSLGITTCACPSFHLTSTTLRLHRFVVCEQALCGLSVSRQRRLLLASAKCPVSGCPLRWGGIQRCTGGGCPPSPPPRPPTPRPPLAFCSVLPSGSVLILQGAFFKLISADLFSTLSFANPPLRSGAQNCISRSPCRRASFIRTTKKKKPGHLPRYSG